MGASALEDQAAIRRLVTLYNMLCDDGRFAEWAELFTEDATFTAMGATTTGREALEAFMETSMPPEVRGRHATVGGSEIVVDGDTARAWTDFFFIGRAAEARFFGDPAQFAVTTVGRYHDTLRRDGGVWRFADRTIVFLGDEHDDPPPGLVRRLA